MMTDVQISGRVTEVSTNLRQNKQAGKDGRLAYEHTYTLTCRNLHMDKYKYYTALGRW